MKLTPQSNGPHSPICRGVHLPIDWAVVALPHARPRKADSCRHRPS